MKPVNILVELLLASLMLATTTAGMAASNGAHGAIQRDGQSGKVRLIAHGTPVRFEVVRLCRYEPESNLWSRVEVAPINKVVGADAVVAELSDSVGLYWVQWKENGRAFASLAVAGPVLCNDVNLAPSSRSDLIATCIPLQHSARAGYVPDPKLYCRQ